MSLGRGFRYHRTSSHIGRSSAQGSWMSPRELEEVRAQSARYRRNDERRNAATLSFVVVLGITVIAGMIFFAVFGGLK